MAQSMILDMLKTPQQVREQQLEKLRQQSLAQANLLQPTRATTGIPGMITGFAQQQMARMPVEYNKMARRAGGAAGTIAESLGASPEVGQALRQAGVTPEELQAQETQGLIRNMIPGDPASMRAVAGQLQKRGLTKAAMELLQQAMQIEKTQAETEAARRKGLKTPDLKEVKEGDEIVTYRMNLDGTRTEVARAPRFEAKAPTTRTRIDGDEKVVEQWDAETQTFEEVSRGPRYEPTDAGEIAAAVYKGSQEQIVDKEAMKYYIDSYAKNNQAVESARKTFVTTDQMRQLLDSGILTGALADVALPAAKLLVQIGAIDSETVENTEQFIKTAARQTVALLASGVFGTAQSITDNDRKFAEGMAGGDITLTADTIRTLINMNEYYATLAFEQQQRGVAQARQAFPESERVKNVFNPMYYDGQQFVVPVEGGGTKTVQWNESIQKFEDI